MKDNNAPKLGEFIKTKFEVGELNDRLQQENEHLEAQKNIRDWIFNQTKEINRTLDFEEMTELAKKTLTGIKGINNFIFFIKKEKKQNYEQIFEHNINEDMKQYLKFFLREKGENFLNEISSHIKSDIMINELGYDLTALNIFPLILKEETIGILLQFENKDFTCTKEVINNIKTVTRYLAMGIKKSLLYNKVQILSRRDGLTSLYLRRVFDEFLKQEFARSKRYKNKLSLIMLDIDFFKKLNDEYGHLFGDKVLSGIAKIIMGNIKAPLTASRYGGEEFVIICPDMDNEPAYNLAEKIRTDVKNQEFIHNNKAVHTAISGGVAEYNNEMEKGDILLKLVDENLYKAKNNGRDQIVR